MATLKSRSPYDQHAHDFWSPSIEDFSLLPYFLLATSPLVLYTKVRRERPRSVKIPEPLKHLNGFDGWVHTYGSYGVPLLLFPSVGSKSHKENLCGGPLCQCTRVVLKAHRSVLHTLCGHSFVLHTGLRRPHSVLSPYFVWTSFNLGSTLCTYSLNAKINKYKNAPISKEAHSRISRIDSTHHIRSLRE